MDPTGMFTAVPSRLGVGEPFELKLRLLGPVVEQETTCWWGAALRPSLRGPFNLNVQRRIQFVDNCLPEWAGILHVDGGDALEGPETIAFNGRNQGVYTGDTRPVARFGPFRWTKPGIHFLRIVEPRSGLEHICNAARVTADPPAERIFWGDPHWQSIFSDGIRAPEELYTFARDEGFLDFGAISDHVEALTDRQWDYFVAVTNDFNAPGRFATLVGQEWTNHEPGHRNIYFRADHGPVLRSNDPRYDTLPKLWKALDQCRKLVPLAIPHHAANKTMGVDWDLGWNPDYEKAVEIYSVWGSSECPAEDGNTRPIGALGGEVPGQHVVDALKRGYRLGFVGGGDVHDGRPGEALHAESYPTMGHVPWPQGLTACRAPTLTREAVFDAIRDRNTYATTNSRTCLDVRQDPDAPNALTLLAASHEGVRDAAVIIDGEVRHRLQPDAEGERVLQRQLELDGFEPGSFCYVRVTTNAGNVAWSTPVWRDDGA